MEYGSSLTSDVIAIKREQTSELVANVLSNQEIVIANYLGLKSFMHVMGMNMSVLPKIYQQLQSRQSKKIIHSALVAKIISKEISHQTIIKNNLKFINLHHQTHNHKIPQIIKISYVPQPVIPHHQSKIAITHKKSK